MADQVFGEDIEPGDEIGPLIKQPDMEQVITFVNAWRRNDKDWQRNKRFSDAGAARRDGLAGPIVPGPMSLGFVSQLLTDWHGPLGRIRSLDVNFRRPALHGEELKCIGLITDTHEEDGNTIVKLDVYIEDPRGDRPTQGVAEVVIPTAP